MGYGACETLQSLGLLLLVKSLNPAQGQCCSTHRELLAIFLFKAYLPGEWALVFFISYVWRFIVISLSVAPSWLNQLSMAKLTTLTNEAMLPISQLAPHRIDTHRIDNRMTVDRKLTFFTVRHEIHRLFRLYSLVNQYNMRTESCMIL